MRSNPTPHPSNESALPPALRRRWLWVPLLCASGCTLDMQGVATMQESTVDPSLAVDGGASDEPEDDVQDAASSELTDATRMRPDAKVAPGAPVDAGATADSGAAPVDAAVGVPPSSARDAAPAQDAKADAQSDAARADASEPGCKLEGTFALRTEVAIAWPGWAIVGIPILSAGEGTFTMDAISVVREADKQVEVRPCAVSIPDFETERNSNIAELYGAYVPDEIWERPSIPRWRASWGASCNQPGCTMFTGVLSAVIGANVDDTFNWPAPGGSLEGFKVADHDGDGKPGLSFVARGPMEMNAEGRAYAYPPLAPSLFARARFIQMAVGMRTQIEGKLETCDKTSGALSLMALRSRALGCSGKRGDEDVVCSPEQVRFLDQNMPAWTVRSAKYQSIRISEQANCTEARAALPPLPAQRGAGPKSAW
jgi:hypothetical protein